MSARPACPSLLPPHPPTACRSLSSVSVFLASLGPKGTASRPLSVERMGLLTRASKRQLRSRPGLSELVCLACCFLGLVKLLNFA